MLNQEYKDCRIIPLQYVIHRETIINQSTHLMARDRCLWRFAVVPVDTDELNWTAFDGIIESVHLFPSDEQQVVTGWRLKSFSFGVCHWLQVQFNRNSISSSTTLLSITYPGAAAAYFHPIKHIWIYIRIVLQFLNLCYFSFGWRKAIESQFPICILHRCSFVNKNCNQYNQFIHLYLDLK